MTKPLVLELKNVGMSFGKECLFKNVNLCVYKGETLVLMGPSGQGKSVLLKLMSGILEPTEGEVFVEGNNLNSMNEKDRRDLMYKVGVLFQKNALFDSLTSGENIGFPLREVRGLPENEVQAKIKSFLDKVAIPHAKDLFPDEISGGMQKRLGIARALALEPDIIFYDDPTAGLDPITSRLIADLIIGLQKERQSTVVAVTNDMNRAYQLANQMAMIVDGEVLLTGDPEQTKKHPDPRVHQFIRGLLEGPLTQEIHDSL